MLKKIFLHNKYWIGGLTIIIVVCTLILNRINTNKLQGDLKNKYEFSNPIPTSYITPTEQAKSINKVIVIEPYLGFSYECREDKLTLVNESFSSYNIAVNTKNSCYNNVETTSNNCADKCNKIWDFCSSNTLWEPLGYKSKNECVDGESSKYNSCRADCRNNMTGELKRCNNIVNTAKETMNNLLKKYCEMSLE